MSSLDYAVVFHGLGSSFIGFYSFPSLQNVIGYVASYKDKPEEKDTARSKKASKEARSEKKEKEANTSIG